MTRTAIINETIFLVVAVITTTTNKKNNDLPEVTNDMLSPLCYVHLSFSFYQKRLSYGVLHSSTSLKEESKTNDAEFKKKVIAIVTKKC